MRSPPDRAAAVIIGGGIVGCSVAYHLAKLGWTDILLLERRKLTCGTTWHAAGLIAQLRSSANMTRLARYSQELYGQLESETGIATGFVRNGSLTVALTDDRREELRRAASMARAFGVDVEDISPTEAGQLHPYLDLEQVRSAIYLPRDGQGDPSNITHALAKGARNGGATIIEECAVTGFSSGNGRIRSVQWKTAGEAGVTATDTVVNCAGMWARDVGRMAGANVPLHACEHFYIVTEPIKEMTRLPVLRVPDECLYCKEDAGKLLIGAFERQAKPWGMNGIPDDFAFDALPDDLDHFEPVLEMATHRLPVLAHAGIRTFFNGPESFTPDTAYLLGPAPEIANLFVAAGFNSVGIQSAGGAGMALAHWMHHGERPFDLGDVDIARMQPFQGNRRYLFERTKESLGLLYDDHFPFRQKVTARGVRRSPLHDALLANGAVMGEVAGWERANWFAGADQERRYDYSWSRPTWFANWRDEHMAVREGVGLYDMSSFGKVRVIGRDAEIALNRVCGADLSVPVGQIVYSQFLNSAGGIEADVTVTRLAANDYLLVTPAATRLADETWIRRHADDLDIVVIDTTAAEAVIAVMGPRSRDVMQAVSPNAFDSHAHPYYTAREIEIGLALARAHRVSYVGELGWEIYVSSDMAAHVFETLIEAGGDHDLRLCGMHMMDSCRSEKGYRHFGHDISPEDHVLEAGLGFAVNMTKQGFIGKAAVQEKASSGLDRRLLHFKLRDHEPMLYHHEPILRDGEIVGYLTSGSYGHSLGAAVGLGYVPCPGESSADLLASTYQIDIAGCRVDADASLRPFYDPTSTRPRA